jgi:hypothetical protein
MGYWPTFSKPHAVKTKSPAWGFEEVEAAVVKPANQFRL